MKLLFALAFTAACAASTSQARINVAQVRHDINAIISHDHEHPRAIVSMGHTTNDAATVYTQTGDVHHEENWVRSANGWTLATTKDTASN